MTVTFFLPDEPHLDTLRHLRPDDHWDAFRAGERAWILQTYLFLARAGADVELSGIVPKIGVLVFHRKHQRHVLRAMLAMASVVLVAVRGDLNPCRIAELEILQRSEPADQQRTFFIAHWPQPGLIPRDSSRGERIERIAFKGRAANLATAFRSSQWRDFLQGLGIDWQLDSMNEPEDKNYRSNWPDFSNVDLVLAVRDQADQVRHKPATKLTNAWQAGVPAILGPEPGYRECRRSELDYLEIESLDDAQCAVKRLIAEPALYRRMVSNGLSRGKEFDRKTTLQRWQELLGTLIPAHTARSRRGWRKIVPTAPRIVVRSLRRQLWSRLAQALRPRHRPTAVH